MAPAKNIGKDEMAKVLYLEAIGDLLYLENETIHS